MQLQLQLFCSGLFVFVATLGTCVQLSTLLTAGRIVGNLQCGSRTPCKNSRTHCMRVQTRVSMERLEPHHVQEERREEAAIHASPTTDEGGMAIETDEEFKWDPSVETPILHDINLHVKKGQKTANCGTVGSGKSSFHSSILGEIPRAAGLELLQVEVELRLLEALEIYHPAKLQGIHRHFILYGLMEYLERRLNHHFSSTEVLELLDRFYNVELLKPDEDESELLSQQEFFLPASILSIREELKESS